MRKNIAGEQGAAGAKQVDAGRLNAKKCAQPMRGHDFADHALPGCAGEATAQRLPAQQQDCQQQRKVGANRRDHEGDERQSKIRHSLHEGHGNYHRLNRRMPAT